MDWRSGTRRAGAVAFMAFAIIGSGIAPAAVSAAGPSGQGTVLAVHDLGTTKLAPSSGTGSSGGTSDAVQPDPGKDLPKDTRPNTGGGSGVPTVAPDPRPNRVASGNDGARGFNGLSHADQRLAGTGVYVDSQFSLEPPDQGLCVGNGYVVEAVNNAMAVYDRRGSMLSGPTALSQFFGLSPEVDRTTGVIGEFISDPKCIYDAPTNRFFLTELMMDNGTNPGATGRTFTLIAVSTSGNPLGTWRLYRFDTTDDGLNGTPSNPGCPCFGDQPLIGADASGFYVSTNEFSISGSAFNGAQVYAMSKWALASGGSLDAIHLQGGLYFPSEAASASYSLQPATTPDGSYARANGGTEYFLGALQFGDTGAFDNRIAVWALSNTSSLRTSSPALTLSHVVIRSEVYGAPNPVAQKPGPAGSTPLGTSLGDGLELINTNDDRMNQTVYADGQLWGALNTQIGDGTRTGIAWFRVVPRPFGDHLGAFMASQGYVSLAKDSVFFPSIAVNGEGQALMAFSVAGPDYFPSAGYVSLSSWGAGAVHISGRGAGPDDGFTGYPQYTGGSVARWGDYSAAVVDENGSFWTAAEYIPNVPRTLLANWGTFITRVSP
ncbi:MAG: hypothetical protein ACYDAN_00560 [Candidatus Limnocylindrales bacterium]